MESDASKNRLRPRWSCGAFRECAAAFIERGAIDYILGADVLINLEINTPARIGVELIPHRVPDIEADKGVGHEDISLDCSRTLSRRGLVLIDDLPTRQRFNIDKNRVGRGANGATSVYCTDIEGIASP